VSPSGSFNLDGVQCDTGENQAADMPTVSLDIPRELAGELVGLYFDKIQPWLSLLHRPRFYARYMSTDGRSVRTLDGYSVTEALLLYGMFALAARYSQGPALRAYAAPDRGRRFTDTATSLYEKARLAVDEPDLTYLQGCILLAFDRYTSGPCHRGWLLSGICVRIAYDLGLCDIDEDDDDDSNHAGILDPSVWTRKEEMRRAWWYVWELDMFGSCMSRRPTMIDRRRMDVHLPVGDEAWFSERPVASAPLRTDPGKAWASLVGCPNQDARAWFLVANYLMTLPIDTLQGGKPASSTESQVLANAIACYALALPPHLRLDSPSVRFDQSTFAKSNWIIAIHVMMLTCRAGVESLCAAADDGRDPRALDWKFRGRELARIVHRWAPDYISLCQPFVACQLIPTYLGHTRSMHTDAAMTDDLGALDESGQDLLMLALARHAEFWKLGSVLLRKPNDS